jgi:hypothetical protein
MKRIALIQSHCNTEEKLGVLRDNIKKLSDLGLDILLFSHILVPQDIIESVKYFIYDNSNPILWEERRHVYWWANNRVKLESSVPDYGWTVFNQIIKSYNSIIDENYEMYFVICYDLIIDDFVMDVVHNNKIGKFKHIKPKHVNEVGDYVDVIFSTSLIFISLTQELIHNFVQNLNKQEYIDNPQWIAEKYLEIVLERNDIILENLGSVSDLLHESKSVFNQSQNPNYEIFIDNQDFLKLRYFQNNLNIKHHLIINDEIFTIDDEEFLFEKECDQINTIGVFVDGVYNDLKNLLNSENKINKVIFY